ncbi:MAG: hypothetical protein ACI86H_001393 [bacterium]|jgi:hypothetical protein
MLFASIRICLILVLFSCFFYSPLSFATEKGIARYWVQQAYHQELWKKQYWRRLFHVSRSFYSFEGTTEIRSNHFFLSKDRSMKNELIKSVRAIFLPPQKNHNTHFSCRFIARATWLIETLKISKSDLPTIHCNEFYRWANLGSIQGIQVLFSGPQLGNPATLFGHPLLRVRRKYKNQFKQLQVLDDTISFGAIIFNDDNFVWKGITGKYQAFYQVEEFHKFKKLYAVYDNRELWSYDLKISKKGIFRLMAHLWEITNIGFDYYFFKANCSYRLAELLEIAYPKRTLIPKYSLTYLPLEIFYSILNSKNPNILKRIEYLPSQGMLLEWKIKSLSDSLRTVFDDTLDDFSKIKSKQFKALSKSNQAILLDTLAEYKDFEILHSKRNQIKPKTVVLEKQWNELILKRTEYPPSKKYNLKKIDFPFYPHQDSERSIFGYYQNSEEEQGIELSFFHHNFAGQRGLSYLPNYQLVGFSGKVEYEEEIWKVDQFSVIKYNHINESAISQKWFQVWMNGTLEYNDNLWNEEEQKHWQTDFGITWNLWSSRNFDQYSYLMSNLFFQENGIRGGFIQVGVIFLPFQKTGVHLYYQNKQQVQPNQQEINRGVIQITQRWRKNWEIAFFSEYQSQKWIQETRLRLRW